MTSPSPVTSATKLMRMLCLCCGTELVAAHMSGSEAEMERLRGKAEEAMLINDPEVAVMNMRRAALMAKLLVKTIMRMSQPSVCSKARNSALFTGTWLSCHGHLSPGRKPTAGLFLGLWNPLARPQQRSIDDFFGHEGNARDPPAPKAVHLRGQSRIG